MAAPDSISTADLPPIAARPVTPVQISRAVTAILRHEYPGEAFTLAGLQRRLHLRVSDEELLGVLRTMRRDHQPRFTETEHQGQMFWRMTFDGRLPRPRR